MNQPQPSTPPASPSVGESRILRASREVAAPAARIFALIADPALQPRWDGNNNLGEAAPGQRVRAVGEVFQMRLSKGSIRDNHVVAFEEGRRIAWRPAPEGGKTPGHQWGWELEPLPGGTEDRTRVTHVYDWTDLDDPQREAKARAMTEQNLFASIDRLAALAEQPEDADGQ